MGRPRGSWYWLLCLSFVLVACSTPPDGRVKWTMQLLADRLVELQIVESISDETVRRTLKKGRSNRGSARNGASPA